MIHQVLITFRLGALHLILLNRVFIQLPACKKCNNSYQVKENHFRDFVANIAKGSGNLAADAAYEKYKRWTEKEYQRLGRPNKDLQRIIDNSDPAIHINIDGKILGTSTIFRDGPEFLLKKSLLKLLVVFITTIQR